MTRAETAMGLFKDGYNCAQAVACAYADLLRQNGWIQNPDVILVGWELQIPA